VANFTSINSPEFWQNCPDELKHMQEGRDGGAAAYFPLGERKDNPPTVIALRLPPGGVLLRHAHDCFRFEVIVQGTLNVGDQVLGVGDVMTSPPNELYGPHVAGPEGCTTFEVFSNYKASHTPIVDLPGGPTSIDVTIPEEHRKLRSLVREVEKSSKAALKAG
jgi:hypothetical protein